MGFLKIKSTVAGAALLLGLTIAVVSLLPVADVFASPATEEACDAIGGCDDGSDVQNVVRNAVNIFTVVVGVVAVIMIVVAGFKYMTAGGDSGKLSSAKNTLIYAIVGLLVASLAQVIVSFVLELN